MELAYQIESLYEFSMLTINQDQQLLAINI